MFISVFLGLLGAVFAVLVYMLYPIFVPRHLPRGYVKVPKQKVESKRVSPLRDGFATKKIPKDIDYIVVGSGIGGLTTGALLSRVGKKVLVLEQHYIAGGCLHCFEDKGYHFDTGLHYIGGVSKYGKLMSLAADREIKFSKLGNEANNFVYDRLIFANGKTFDLCPGGRTALRKRLEKMFPESLDDIDVLMKDLLKSRRTDALPYILRVLPRWMVLPFAWLAKSQGWTKRMSSTVTKTLEKIKNPFIRSIILGNSGDEGGSPDTNCWLARTGVFKHYITEGGFYPIGGPEAIADALVRSIEDAGGRVLVRAPVEKVLMSGGKVVGVNVRKGDGVNIKAKEGVIAACGAKVLFDKLLPSSVPFVKHSQKILKNIQQSAQHLSIFVGMNKPQSELKLPSHNYWVLPNLDTETGIYKSPVSMESKYNYKPFDSPALAFLGFPSAKDPSYEEKNPGKSVAVIITEAPYEFFEKWASQKSGAREAEYKALKQKLAQKYLDEVLFRFHPELKDCVDFVDVGTPLSSEFYLGAPHGASYGLEQTPYRFFDNDVIQTLRSDTPIPGLWQAGQDSLSSGVVGALMSAYFTTSNILGYSVVETFSKNGLIKHLKNISSLPDIRKSKFDI